MPSGLHRVLIHTSKINIYNKTVLNCTSKSITVYSFLCLKFHMLIITGKSSIFVIITITMNFPKPKQLGNYVIIYTSIGFIPHLFCSFILIIKNNEIDLGSNPNINKIIAHIMIKLVPRNKLDKKYF